MTAEDVGILNGSSRISIIKTAAYLQTQILGNIAAATPHNRKTKSQGENLPPQAMLNKRLT